jgi:hypothetical protein
MLSLLQTTTNHKHELVGIGASAISGNSTFGDTKSMKTISHSTKSRSLKPSSSTSASK